MPRRAPLAGALRKLSEVVATAVFDSLKAPELAVGYRGGPGQRLVRYEWDAGHVDVRIAQDRGAPGRFWVTGQTYAEPPVTQIAAHARGSDQASSTGPAEDGYFELLIESGEYDLRLDVGDSQVLLALPTIGESGP